MERSPPLAAHPRDTAASPAAGPAPVVLFCLFDIAPRFRLWGWSRFVVGRFALRGVPGLRFVKVLGSGDELNQSLEKAGRVADFLEFGELMCRDALHRAESCGGHFREEYQTPDGEALRNDEKFCHVAAWEWKGEGAVPERHTEALEFESVHLATRSYK